MGRKYEPRTTEQLRELTPAQRQRVSQAATRGFLRAREEELNRRQRQLEAMRRRAGMT